MNNKYNADLAYRLRVKGMWLDPQLPWEPAELKAAVIKLNEAIAQLETADETIDKLASNEVKAAIESSLAELFEEHL